MTVKPKIYTVVGIIPFGLFFWRRQESSSTNDLNFTWFLCAPIYHVPDVSVIHASSVAFVRSHDFSTPPLADFFQRALVICSLRSTKLAKNLHLTILHLSATWRDGFKNSISLNVSNDNNSSSTISVVRLRFRRQLVFNCNCSEVGRSLNVLRSLLIYVISWFII